MTSWFDFAVAAVLIVLVVACAIAFGWKWAEHRTPGALALGDRVDIKDHGTIIGKMVLVEFTQHLDQPTTATLTDLSTFLTEHTIPGSPGTDAQTQWSWDR